MPRDDDRASVFGRIRRRACGRSYRVLHGAVSARKSHSVPCLFAHQTRAGKTEANPPVPCQGWPPLLKEEYTTPAIYFSSSLLSCALFRDGLVSQLAGEHEGFCVQGQTTFEGRSLATGR